MEYYNSFRTAFWSEAIWLPPNTTWADIAPDAMIGVKHTNPNHLFYPIPMAIVVTFIRYALEKYWFSPIGKSLGIKHARPKKAPVVPALESAYVASKKWKHKQIQGLAKQLDMSERQVERWLRLRKGQNKPSTLVKFCETAWRCTYYIFSFFYGISILWDKPWLWNIQECWTNYPHQTITSDIWWLYMISLSFYLSLCVSQFFDVKRKDFWHMFVHHLATIALMCLSWVVNVFRIGSLTIVVHDCADMFLESAKLAKYASYQKVCDTLFAIFTVVWIVTRIIIFPFWIIKNTSIDAPKVVPMFPAYYIFNSLFIILLILHLFWTYLILQIAYNAINAGQMEGDIRSNSDDYSDDSNENNDNTNETK